MHAIDTMFVAMCFVSINTRCWLARVAIEQQKHNAARFCVAIKTHLQTIAHHATMTKPSESKACIIVEYKAAMVQIVLWFAISPLWFARRGLCCLIGTITPMDKQMTLRRLWIGLE